MSLDPPTYLASLQSNIRQRPIPWDGAVRAGTLTETQLGMVRAVDKAKKPEQRQEIVEASLSGYTALFVGGDGQTSIFESAAKHPNVVQYILVLLSDLLECKLSIGRERGLPPPHHAALASIIFSCEYGLTQRPN